MQQIWNSALASTLQSSSRMLIDPPDLLDLALSQRSDFMQHLRLSLALLHTQVVSNGRRNQRYWERFVVL